MTTTISRLEVLVEEELEEVEFPSPRYAAQRMVAARNGDLEERILLNRARVAGETHRRSDSHEGLPLD